MIFHSHSVDPDQFQESSLLTKHQSIRWMKERKWKMKSVKAGQSLLSLSCKSWSNCNHCNLHSWLRSLRWTPSTRSTQGCQHARCNPPESTQLRQPTQPQQVIKLYIINLSIVVPLVGIAVEASLKTTSHDYRTLAGCLRSKSNYCYASSLLSCSLNALLTQITLQVDHQQTTREHARASLLPNNVIHHLAYAITKTL